MKSKRVILFCCTGVFFFLIYVSARDADLNKNNPPKVEILTPKNASPFDWNSFIRYSIRVTDTEDGSSEYQEISSKEVFLKVTYLPGDSKAIETAAIKAGMMPELPGFEMMKTSACFNCHMVKGKLAGPSFFEIAQKYPYNSATIDLLANKVIKGSSGVWTNTAMPPNPDFTWEQSKQIIQWILKTAKDINKDYLPGTEGTFKTRGRPQNGKGSYILTASYTDHGIRGIPKSNLRGTHTVVIHSR